MYRYGNHFIDSKDIESIINVLQSDFLTCGPQVEEFEKVVSNEFEYNHGLAVNSGTAALHLVIESLNLQPDDEVIVPSITFLATSNVVLMVGAKVVFADVNPDTLLIDVFDVDKKITEKTKAIIAVDMAGQLCDYLYLKNICLSYNIVLISDACHSIGLQYFLETEKPDFVCYSFHPVKHITTGEGGMVLTDDLDKYLYMNRMRSHGMGKNKNMLHMGYNYRMPDINAALGISQFKYKLNDFIRKRQDLANLYYKKLNKYCLALVSKHSYHLFIIKCENRQEVRNHLNNKGIGTQIHYRPIYDNDYYKLNGYENAFKLCPNTEEIKNKILTIPLYYKFDCIDVEYISKCILEVIK